MGGIAMVVSVIPVLPKETIRRWFEARRTPPRVRSLMEIVGSDEQMACVGFAMSPATLGPMIR